MDKNQVSIWDDIYRGMAYGSADLLTIARNAADLFQKFGREYWKRKAELDIGEPLSPLVRKLDEKIKQQTPPMPRNPTFGQRLYTAIGQTPAAVLEYLVGPAVVGGNFPLGFALVDTLRNPDPMAAAGGAMQGALWKASGALGPVGAAGLIGSTVAAGSLAGGSSIEQAVANAIPGALVGGALKAASAGPEGIHPHAFHPHYEEPTWIQQLRLARAGYGG